jgi:hypothetical protein
VFNITYFPVFYVNKYSHSVQHKIGILYVEHWEYLFIQNTGDYYMLSTAAKIIYTKYLVILYVENWEDLFT